MRQKQVTIEKYRVKSRFTEMLNKLLSVDGESEGDHLSSGRARVASEIFWLDTQKVVLK